METYQIIGGQKLEGEVQISGSKNAALPIIAASILTPKIAIIENCPNIHDVQVMLEILKGLGCKIEKEGHTIKIDSSEIKETAISENLMHEMRSSVIIAGALLGRMKRCTFTYPGGCEIGARPINMHLEGFKQLGVEIIEEDGKINCNCEKMHGTDITLDFPSVGATENIMLASCKAEGTTYIRNVAREPEIKDLQDFLVKMGANIKGAGSNTIIVKGVTSLNSVTHKVIPDRIEAGTYLFIGAATKGKLAITNIIPEHINSATHKLKQMGCKIKSDDKQIELKVPDKIMPLVIKTMPYPGFPTDMQSQISALLTTASGTSIIEENIFENRFKYVNELLRMGAQIHVQDRTAIIQGVNKLHSANVEMKDLRGGAALVLAALMAEGESTLTGIKYLERGYENIVKKLSNIGAIIEKK